MFKSVMSKILFSIVFLCPNYNLSAAISLEDLGSLRNRLAEIKVQCLDPKIFEAICPEFSKCNDCVRTEEDFVSMAKFLNIDDFEASNPESVAKLCKSAEDRVKETIRELGEDPWILLRTFVVFNFFQDWEFFCKEQTIELEDILDLYARKLEEFNMIKFLTENPTVDSFDFESKNKAIIKGIYIQSKELSNRLELLDKAFALAFKDQTVAKFIDNLNETINKFCPREELQMQIVECQKAIGQQEETLNQIELSESKKQKIIDELNKGKRALDSLSFTEKHFDLTITLNKLMFFQKLCKVQQLLSISLSSEPKPLPNKIEKCTVEEFLNEYKHLKKEEIDAIKSDPTARAHIIKYPDNTIKYVLICDLGRSIRTLLTTLLYR